MRCKKDLESINAKALKTGKKNNSFIIMSNV